MALDTIFSRSETSSRKGSGSRCAGSATPNEPSGECELIGLRIHPLHWGPSVHAFNGLRVDDALQRVARKGGASNKSTARRSSRLCTFPLPTTIRSETNDTLASKRDHGSLEHAPCCRASISFAESALILFCRGSSVELLRLPLWWAEIGTGYDRVTGELVILVRTQRTSFDNLGDVGHPSSLELRTCEETVPCPCHVCGFSVSCEEHWFNRERVLLLCLQCLPKGAIFNSWLFIVNCEDEQISDVMDSLGAAGAIWTNFTEHYSIVQEKIGCGSYAEVHIIARLPCVPKAIGRADRHAIDSQAVLKIIKDDHSRDMQAMVQKEVRLLSAVQRHPNIVHFHGVVRFDSWPLGLGNQEKQPRWGMIMEYCKNGDMFDAVKRGPLSEEQSRLVMRGVFAALSYLQHLGIVHRDVKAENVLVASGGRPVLADFGLGARLFDVCESKRTCGTLGYTAPEIIMGIEYNTKVDVFSAGVLLFFMLSGKLPFSGGGNVRVAVKQTLNSMLSFNVSAHLTYASHMCKGFILMCTQKEKENRFCAKAALCDQWLTTKILMPRKVAALSDANSTHGHCVTVDGCRDEDRLHLGGRCLSRQASDIKSCTTSARTTQRTRATSNSGMGATTRMTCRSTSRDPSNVEECLERSCSAFLFASHSENTDGHQAKSKWEIAPPDTRPPVDRYRRVSRLGTAQLVKNCEDNLFLPSAPATSRVFLRPGV